MGVAPRVQSRLSRALHAHHGVKLLTDLCNQEGNTSKKVMVRFKGAREKGAMALVECQGISQEETMEGFLRRETLGRSWGSHDAAEPVGGMCYGNGRQEETTRLHAISCSKTGWSSLTHNRELHHVFARSLRESKVQIVIEETWSSRQRAGEQHSVTDPLGMEVTTEAGTLFSRNSRLKDKGLLLDLAIVNPCVSTILVNPARQTKKTLADAVL